MNIHCHNTVKIMTRNWRIMSITGRVVSTWWRRSIGCLIFIGHLPQKSPIINGSFAKNDLQLKVSYGSSPPCNKRHHFLCFRERYMCMYILIYIHEHAITYVYVTQGKLLVIMGISRKYYS